MKRTITICIILSILLMTALHAFAVQVSDDFSQVSVNMPDIIVELKGNSFEAEQDDISASLGGNALNVEDFHPYDQSKDSTLVYMLVDTSGTIARDSSYGEMIKDYIKHYAGNMSQQDAMVIVTFGKEVKKIQDATSDRDKIAKAVDKLTFNDDYTRLYDALDFAYNEAASNVTGYTRTYAMLFSDCADDTKTGITESEIKNKYMSHQLPLYVAAPDFAEKADTEVLGPIARASGGSLEKPENISEMNEFGDRIDNVSILKLKADTNLAAGEEQNLQVSFGDYSFNTKIMVARSVVDKEAPVIKKLSYDQQNNRFVISFSEKVTDASQKGSYSVVDEHGKKWTIAEAEAPTASETVQLVMAEQIPNGLYTITASNLTDTSNQKNALTENSKSIEVTGIVLPVQEDGFFALPLLIALGAGVLLIGAIVAILVIVLNSKKSHRDDTVLDIPTIEEPQRAQVINEYEDTVSSVKHHIKNNNTIKLQLLIKTGNSSEQRINTEVFDSVIVGRSSICEVFIDDTKLSRQHFALENVKQELVISDLNSKNGTFVNGVRITGRRKLMNHDRIVAGLTEIQVMITE